MTLFKFVRSRISVPPPPLAVTVLLALPFVIAPTVFRWAIDGVVTETTFVAYFPFVLLAALLLGWRGAVVVMLVSAMLANFLFMTPRHVLFAAWGDTLGAAIFVVSSSLMIVLAEALRRTVMEVDRSALREGALNSELKHLNSELLHRVKNTLAVVQALAVQTFRGDAASDEAVRTFKGRLQALAQAQDVLTSGRWETCQLPDLALRALAPFNGQGALNIHGPTCSLPEVACVPLVLALHELGTNAAKYGALSSLSGAVDLTWEAAEAPNGRSEVVLTWVERDGPPVTPPTRQGLGSRLLKRQRGLDEVALEFRPAGLQCRVVIGRCNES